MNHTYFASRIACILAVIILICSGCKKDWLDKKPDKSILVPTTLSDFESLLNNDLVMNTSPGIEEVSSDDFYITYDIYQFLPTATERNSYLWKKEIYEGETNGDWNGAYQTIFFSNVILDGLQNLQRDATNANEYNNVKGRALFFRAFAYYNLAQVFAQPFSLNADSALGIPLRMHADINAPITRGTLSATYNQVKADLCAAMPLLPLMQQYKTQPTELAIKALFARMYLSMQNYDSAYKYATEVLTNYSSLMNYNSLDTTAYTSIDLFNPEVIFDNTIALYTILSTPYAIIDTTLYKSYSDKDLRKYVFYIDDGRGNKVLKSSYGGSPYRLFNGFATDEMYLIKAECMARANNVDGAMSVLNNLLETRYASGSFIPLSSSTSDQVLRAVLTERRKELIFRGLRWSDLRRLNMESRFAETLHRTLNGQQYELDPNSLLYTFPIPPDEIKLSHIEQNPR